MSEHATMLHALCAPQTGEGPPKVTVTTWVTLSMFLGVLALAGWVTVIGLAAWAHP